MYIALHSAKALQNEKNEPHAGGTVPVLRLWIALSFLRPPWRFLLICSVDGVLVIAPTGSCIGTGRELPI